MRDFSVAQMVKDVPAMQETWVRSLGPEDPLEEEMAAHSSILAWRIPWTEEPGGPRHGVAEPNVTEQLTHTHVNRAWFQFTFCFSQILNFVLFLPVLGLCCCAWAFSSGGEWGLRFAAGHMFLSLWGLTCGGAQTLNMGSAVVAHSWVAPWCMGSSCTRDRTHVPCTGGQTLSHEPPGQSSADSDDNAPGKPVEHWQGFHSHLRNKETTP